MKLFCPLCETEARVEYLDTYKNNNKTFNNKSLYQCQDCSLIFIHPMPGLDDLAWYYKNVWIKDKSTVCASKETETVYQIQARERAKYLTCHVELSDNVRLLDVGSGFGYLFDAFKERGFDRLNFFATDPNPDNLKRLEKKGINTFSDIIEIKERNFDLIAICFVLEHISEPIRFLSQAIGHLKSGGWIFIDLPERDDTFKPILEPHVAVYTIESLSNLVNKLGLEIVHITGYGVERSKLIAEANLKRSALGGINNKFNSLFSKIGKRFSGNNKTERQIVDLYKYYKFNEEGKDRWWIRAILRKPL